MSGKCLKEYANNDCYISELKHEKDKLHTKYLLSISIGLIILSVIIVTNGGEEFSNQLSMASTISSIILSAIAIFMSISGENKMSGVQNQLIETATKLAKVTGDVSIENAKIQEQLEEKLKEISDISEGLNEIKTNIFEVKNQVSMTGEKIDKISTTNTFSDGLDSSFRKDQIINIYKLFRENYQGLGNILDRVMEYVLILSLKFECSITFNEVKDFYEMEYKDYNLDETVWGAALVFSALGIRRDKQLVSELLNICSEYQGNNKLNNESVIKFHLEYEK